MSTPNLDSRYITPSQVDTKIANQATTDAGQYATQVSMTAKPFRMGGSTGNAAVLPYINVKDYGALGDGTTDDSTAFQNAVNALSVGGTLIIPSGTYVVTTGITIATTITVRGVGRQVSIVQSAAQIVIFTVSADNVVFEDFTLKYSAVSVPTSGSGIQFASGGYGSIRHMRVSSFYDNIVHVSSYAWMVIDSYIVNAWRYGMYIQDQAATDRGDASIGANTTFDNSYTTVAASIASGASTFSVASSSSIVVGQTLTVGYSTTAEAVSVTAVSGTTITISGTFANTHAANERVNRGLAAIRHESGGGLKISATKVLNHAVGLDALMVDGVATSVLSVTGNSFENMNVAAIRLGAAASTGTFAYYAITGNEFSVSGEGVRLYVGSSDGVISGNIFKGGNVGVDIVNGQNHFVTANTFRQWNVGIQIAANVLAAAVGINRFRACTYDVTDNTVLAAGNTLGVIQRLHRRNLTGLTNATGSAPTNAFQIDCTSLRTATLRITAEGAVPGIGTVLRQDIIALRYGSSGNATATSLQSLTDGTAIDIVYDVTTTAGSLLLGFLRNSSAGGSTFTGTVTLEVTGHVKRIQLL